MKKRFGILSVCILVLCGIAVGGVLCYVWASPYLPGGAHYPAAAEPGDYDKLDEIRAYLDYYFVGDLDETQLMDGAASGLISGTGDRWSYYISAEDLASYTEKMENAYVGVGITIRANEAEDGFTVTLVNAGGPAEAAGVQPGDELIAVGGANAWELGMDETKNRVRGEAGTTVALTFRRDGEPYDVTLTRAKVETQIVSWNMLRDNTALIQIANFDTNSCRDAIAAIEAAREAGARALVFDVRNNPGGLKHELVKLLDYLLPEGPLFRSTSYDGKSEVDYSDKDCLSMPMAVLVNRDSYSAAEFFAVALQEYDWATVIGTGTSGKGYYQNTFYLTDGSAIAISTGEYRTPQDKSLVGVGIEPDVYVELDSEDYVNQYYGLLDWQDDEQILAALDALQMDEGSDQR